MEASLRMQIWLGTPLEKSNPWIDWSWGVLSLDELLAG